MIVEELAKLDDGEVVLMKTFQTHNEKVQPILDLSNDKYDYYQGSGDPYWYYPFDWQAMKRAGYREDVMHYYKSFETLTSNSWKRSRNIPANLNKAPKGHHTFDGKDISHKFFGWNPNMDKDYSFMKTEQADMQFNEWILNNTEKVKIAKGKRIRYCKVKLMQIDKYPEVNPGTITVLYRQCEKGDFLNEL